MQLKNKKLVPKVLNIMYRSKNENNVKVKSKILVANVNKGPGRYHQVEEFSFRLKMVISNQMSHIESVD